MAKKKNLIQQTFNKLTVVSEASKQDKNPRAMWNCICECGGSIIVSTNHLTTGNTKSCGCLKSEKSQNNIQKAIDACRVYDPHITSGRKLWRQYCYEDKECNLSFEEWLILTQKNCFYCDVRPSNIYNLFLKKENASQQAKDNGYFIYNGLDRVDNSRPHVVENVVPCCSVCNRAKSDRSVIDFTSYISNLHVNTKLSGYDLLELPTRYLLVSVKCAFRHYKLNYSTMEIDLQTFYTYSQQPCFYCSAKKINYFNIYSKDKKASQAAKDGAHFYYNGIDRLNNTNKHTIDNIVPCCYYCNFAKGKLALPEFQVWIKRVKEYQQDKLVNDVQIT